MVGQLAILCLISWNKSVIIEEYDTQNVDAKSQNLEANRTRYIFWPSEHNRGSVSVNG